MYPPEKKEGSVTQEVHTPLTDTMETGEIKPPLITRKLNILINNINNSPAHGRESHFL